MSTDVADDDAVVHLVQHTLATSGRLDLGAESNANATYLLTR
jgi:NAD(P)-dependent dehydrogenase (short-subunit alcohol dehydrogenase family)